MRYVKKHEDFDWMCDERPREKVVRVRRRPQSPRVTRQMKQLDVELLRIAARCDDRPTELPPADVAPPTRRVGPPPLPIPFPFPFVNAAGSAMNEDVIDVRDSWLLPAPVEMSGRSLNSLRPSEPAPFTLYPPKYSMLPR